ncbi:hypothetical protein HMPREF1207_02633 [Paenibacillus sp. HGH0039]|nr:hypothetical protein HMPREF1207_02633 [Paenibacillus sp. HGH0039]
MLGTSYLTSSVLLASVLTVGVITFQQQDGRNFTIKTKNYACSDAEWFTLLQNLHIAARKLNIPLEVDIPPNRPLHIFSVNDEKERAS